MMMDLGITYYSKIFFFQYQNDICFTKFDLKILFCLDSIVLIDLYFLYIRAEVKSADGSVQVSFIAMIRLVS